MNEYYQEHQNVVGDYSAAGLNIFMSKVFGRMFLGLLLTALTSAAFIYGIMNVDFVYLLATNSFFFYGMIVGEFLLVIALNAAINKISSFTAGMLFALYAMANGITLSFVFLAYLGEPWVIMRAFIMTAVFFGTMSVYGLVTKADLTSAGKIFTVGLFALIITSVINMFIGSSTMDYIVCIAGLGIFIGLTAYDVQKLKNFYMHQSAADGQVMSKVAIIGALQLYLDFINIFLFLIRILGRKR